MTEFSVVVPDPLHFGNPDPLDPQQIKIRDPDPHQIKKQEPYRIRTHIKVISQIWICIQIRITVIRIRNTDRILIRNNKVAAHTYVLTVLFRIRIYSNVYKYMYL
jgi:hypothetical protein